jgi:thiol-disulfide isomerase/thioredoxin
MKNIIIILLILILPVAAYYTLSSKSSDKAFAINPENPSMLIFTSTMCKDCQIMKKILKEVENNYNEKINFVYIDALKNNKKTQEQIKEYGITLVPTLVFTDVNNIQTKKIEGSVPKEELVIAIEDCINE